MSNHRRLLGALWLLGVPVAAYGAVAAHAWWRYGSPATPNADEHDAMLDAVMPRYDIVERHRVAVRAPAAITFQAACDVDLFASSCVSGIFRTRELLLGARSARATAHVGLIAFAESLGWRMLGHIPGREVVMGAVTQPWAANVVFQGMAAERFREFDDPGNVKIAWTLRADPTGDGHAIFRSETRALATDATARRKFRRYWSLVSPGVWLIRRLTLPSIKTRAERQWSAGGAGTPSPAPPGRA